MREAVVLQERVTMGGWRGTLAMHLPDWVIMGRVTEGGKMVRRVRTAVLNWVLGSQGGVLDELAAEAM